MQLTDLQEPLIFIKTDKGYDEMILRRAGLDLRRRRVLILLDGSRDVDAVAQLTAGTMSTSELRKIVFEMLDQGFIMAAEPVRKSRQPSLDAVGAT